MASIVESLRYKCCLPDSINMTLIQKFFEDGKRDYIRMFVSLCVFLSEFFVIFLHDVIYLFNDSYTKVHLIYSFILCYFNNHIFFQVLQLFLQDLVLMFFHSENGSCLSGFYFKCYYFICIFEIPKYYFEILLPCPVKLIFLAMLPSVV